MKNWRNEQLCLVPAELSMKIKAHRGKHLADAYQTTLLRRAEQPLFLLRAAMQSGARAMSRSGSGCKRRSPGHSTRPSASSSNPTSMTQSKGSTRDELIDMAERECAVLMEECSSVDIVGRYDGANVLYREAHRRNFNQLFNPFVLLVSRVGEEVIDLRPPAGT